MAPTPGRYPSLKEINGRVIVRLDGSDTSTANAYRALYPKPGRKGALAFLDLPIGDGNLPGPLPLPAKKGGSSLLTLESDPDVIFLSVLPSPVPQDQWNLQVGPGKLGGRGCRPAITGRRCQL